VKSNSEIHIGKNIQTIRHILGIKQEILAAKLKITQQTLSKIEARSKIEDKLLGKIADILEVSMAVIKSFEKAKIIHQINKNTYNDTTNIGQKIEGVRRFLRVSQTELGSSLGITKQAVSKMERAKKMEDDKISQVANALGVSENGLKNFNQEAIQYLLYRSILSETKVNSFDNSNILRLEKAIKFLQNLLKKEKSKIYIF